MYLYLFVCVFLGIDKKIRGNVSAVLSYDMHDTKSIEVNNDYDEISCAKKKVGME